MMQDPYGSGTPSSSNSAAKAPHSEHLQALPRLPHLWGIFVELTTRLSSVMFVLKYIRYRFHMTYEYECSTCKHTWESEDRISSSPQTKCPKCGKETAKRLISATTFVLKGGGWASDGYS